MGVVAKRVSAVSASASPPALPAAGDSVKIPATSGRTSPGRVSTGVPSIATVVAAASEPSAIVQSPGGQGDGAQRAPAVVTVTPAGRADQRQPGQRGRRRVGPRRDRREQQPAPARGGAADRRGELASAGTA